MFSYTYVWCLWDILFHMYITNLCFFVIFLSAGSAVEQFPRYLWWAAADVHCTGGGWICQGHPREHAQHSGHWPVYGRGQTAVYCSHSWEPPLLLSWWDQCDGLCEVFCVPEDTTSTVQVNPMCTQCFHFELHPFPLLCLFPQSLVVFCCQWFCTTSTCICASRGSCSSVLGS